MPTTAPRPIQAPPRPTPTRAKLRATRDQLHITSWRNTATIAALWASVATAGWLVGRVSVWFAPLAVLAMGPIIARFAILTHEAAHQLLYRNRRWNDLAGRCVLSYPVMIPFTGYRVNHLAHHRAELGDGEPDVWLYKPYPTTKHTWRHRLWRDATGRSAHKLVTGLITNAVHARRWGTLAGIIGAQVAVIAGLWVISGRWWVGIVIWLLPQLTVWRVLNRVRAVAEHGGLTHDTDRRRTCHVVRQTWAARLLITPYHTGYHLAHHCDTRVPWRQLPGYHHTLEQRGYIEPGDVWPNYRTLIGALTSEHHRT